MNGNIYNSDSFYKTWDPRIGHQAAVITRRARLIRLYSVVVYLILLYLTVRLFASYYYPIALVLFASFLGSYFYTQSLIAKALSIYFGKTISTRQLPPMRRSDAFDTYVAKRGLKAKKS